MSDSFHLRITLFVSLFSNVNKLGSISNQTSVPELSIYDDFTLLIETLKCVHSVLPTIVNSVSKISSNFPSTISHSFLEVRIPYSVFLLS